MGCTVGGGMKGDPGLYSSWGNEGCTVGGGMKGDWAVL